MEVDNFRPRRSSRLQINKLENQPVVEKKPKVTKPKAEPKSKVETKSKTEPKAIKRPSPVSKKAPTKKKVRVTKKIKEEDNEENLAPNEHEDLEIDLPELDVPREWSNLLQRPETPTSPKAPSVIGSVAKTDEMSDIDEEDSDEAEDWEDVESAHQPPVRPTVEVHVEIEDKKKIEKEKEKQEIKKLIEAAKYRAKRDLNEDLHKLNYLGFVSHAHFLMKCCKELVKKKEVDLHSLLDCDLSSASMTSLEDPLRGFRSQFVWEDKLETSDYLDKKTVVERLLYMIKHKQVETNKDMTLMIAILFLTYEIDCRLCVGFTAEPELMPLKPSTANPKEKAKKVTKKSKSETGKGKSVPTQVLNYWAEFYDEENEIWIPVHPSNEEICSHEEVESYSKFVYAVAVDNCFGTRDVTGRYVEDYTSVNFRKGRLSDVWIMSVMSLPFLAANKKRSLVEDQKIRSYLFSKPLPTKMCEYKNHPLYVLEKDLLKFEAIYPPDTKSLGTCGKHDVYPRANVVTLQGELNWIRQARSVKEGEEPYKVVKARPKLSIPAEERVPLFLNVYGPWQTEVYKRPKVVNGKIPRNEYGNVYMYQPNMVPEECVHLKEKGVLAMAKSLDLEAVPAVTGWEFSGGRNHPLIEGCVVLEKDAEVLRAACREWADIRKQKKIQATEDKVLQLWKRFVRGKQLLVKMKKRYNVEE
ncbi:hypothetical protein M3Y96_00238400 [Aphelenchoides besseyi]|nr:hypothetical protein M3Y96_00238400 [Aphelenchoides besseyi]